MPLLAARGLCNPPLGPLDLDLEVSECVCVTGPSGSGKSLLLRALADLDPHAGTVTLDGIAQESIAPTAWRRRVMLLAADSAWWAPKVCDHFPPDADLRLAALGFTPSTCDWEVERLSSGERQRLALLRVLAHNPVVLLLDEPTANLDDDNAARVEKLVLEWLGVGGRAVLWVSHDHDQVKRVADRHLHLEDGKWTRR